MPDKIARDQDVSACYTCKKLYIREMKSMGTPLINEKLKQLKETFATKKLQQLFAEDPQRAEKYSLQAAGIFLDYSKNLIDVAVFEQLLGLTESANLSQKIQNLFNGAVVNFTENRPALHTTLREPIKSATPEIAAVRQQMKNFSDAINAGVILGHDGKRFTDVVNIGIGGSDLGPKIVCEALRAYQKNALNFHFISNIDDYPLIQLLNKLNPDTTLFIVASKSFTTIETLLNTETAKQWFIEKTQQSDAWQQHFVAVTANPAKAKEAGFKTIFTFWDWVGGRYSLWSAVGLSIVLCIGADNFEKFLAGAHAMDLHFKENEFNENMPVILALLEIWYANFWQAETHAVIPYCAQLHYLPNYLQQLVMESNGKSVNRMGETVSYQTSAIIWGETGSNCQHSFMQLLHQSQRLIPVDFIASLTTEGSVQHHQHLLANCFSQARVLMTGKTVATAAAELLSSGMTAEAAKQLAPHKFMPGNHPSNMILLEKLSPETLGALIALYEHKVYVAAAIWNINPFDQWGVEMGKQVATAMLPTFQKNGLCLEYDASTKQLLQYYRDYNNEKT